ncbi:MAG TPA: ABC transporter permease [Thermomicrobiales bacterium]|nr:ABC transporter permease [Thermomicrobiales bacterium]
MATSQASAAPALLTETRKTRRAANRWLHNRNLLVGAGILGALVLLAILAPLLTPYQPLAQDYSSTLRPPSLAHPFGTDNFGRDVLTRIIYGTRIDLRVGLTAVIAPFLIGITLGSLAGYFSGWFDTIIMRCVDVVQAFPFIVLIVAIVAVLGPGLNNMYVAVALTAWIVYARLIRGEILVVKQKEYVQASRALGLTDVRIIVRHVLPNVITASIVYSMADIALYIGLAAALSYLGLGAKPPAPEWGVMITEGQPFMTTAWWMSALPGLALVITGIGLSLVGDGLSDALRPGAR